MSTPTSHADEMQSNQEHQQQQQQMSNSPPATPTHQLSPPSPPPPYPTDTGHDLESEAVGPANAHPAASKRISISAPLTVRGTGNHVSCVPRVSIADLAAAVAEKTRQLNGGRDGDADGAFTRNLTLEINCGITVVGNGNCVGDIAAGLAALRRRAMAARTAGTAGAVAVAAGVKRKAGGEEVVGAPVAKAAKGAEKRT